MLNCCCCFSLFFPGIYPNTSLTSPPHSFCCCFVCLFVCLFVFHSNLFGEFKEKEKNPNFFLKSFEAVERFVVVIKIGHVICSKELSLVKP